MVPAVVLLAALCSVAAQAPLAEDRLRMPAGLPPGVDAVAADLDGDGSIDVARAAAQSLTLLFQRPSGAFELNPAQVPLAFPAPVRAVALARLRPGATLPDLVVTLQIGAPVLLWNNGQGTFARAPTTVPTNPGPNLRTVIADFDRVAPDDLLVLAEQGRPQLLLAQAGTGYSDASALLGAGVFLQSPRALAADFDGDGDDDFAVASGVAGQPFVLENLGSSVRTVPLPVRGSYTAIASADLNLDRRPDLILAHTGPPGLEFVLNLATGFVSYVPAAPLTLATDVRALTTTDLGGNGSPDLAVLLVDGRVVVGIHDGLPAFRFTPSALPVDPGPRAALLAADLDSDTDVDFVLVGTRADEAGLRDSILLGDLQAASWFDTEALAMPNGVVLARGALAVVDADADAEPDLVAFGAVGRGLVYHNDGAARFRELTAQLPNLATRDVVRVLPAAISSTAARDLLVVSSAAAGAAQPPGIRLLVAPVAQGPYTDGTARLPASVNQGFRDVAVLRGGGSVAQGGVFVAADAANQLRAYEALAGAVVDAPGAFFPAIAAAPVRRILVGDVDGDLRDDVVLLQDGAATTLVEVYLRVGNVAPWFRSTGLPLAMTGTVTAAVLADFDGDGPADLVATLAAGAPQPLAFLGGAAGGALVDRSAARFIHPLPTGYDAIAVLPARARPRSLLLGSSAGGPLWFLPGRGAAPFAAPAPIDVHGAPPVAHLQIADLDGDGDADCVVVPPLGRPAVLLGTELHCATAGVTQAGRQMVLRMRAASPGSIAAWLWSPAGSARLEVPPYGLLRLAPPVVSLLVLPIGPTLVQDLAVPIPPASALATLYFQAAIFDPVDLSVRLSNLEPALILAR